MNIFFLSNDPVKAAQMECDKHVVKMILESAQMLCTAHRVLDGTITRGPSKSGLTTVKQYQHPDPVFDQLLYKAVHVNHPSAVWTRENSANYNWHYRHFAALCEEYTFRYEKVHKTDYQLRGLLSNLPANIPYADKPTKAPLAMFDECKISDDTVECYRNYYMTKQDKFNVRWTKRHAPEWFRYNDEVYVL